MKILKKNRNMICGLRYFITELKTKIDVIPRSCFKDDIIYSKIYSKTYTVVNINKHMSKKI